MKTEQNWIHRQHQCELDGDRCKQIISAYFSSRIFIVKCDGDVILTNWITVRLFELLAIPFVFLSQKSAHQFQLNDWCVNVECSFLYWFIDVSQMHSILTCTFYWYQLLNSVLCHGECYAAASALNWCEWCGLSIHQTKVEWFNFELCLILCRNCWRMTVKSVHHVAVIKNIYDESSIYQTI